MQVKRSAQEGFRMVTQKQDHCPWIVPVGEHCYGDCVTLELPVRYVEEFEYRHHDWIDPETHYPRIQVFVNSEEHPDAVWIYILKTVFPEGTVHIEAN